MTTRISRFIPADVTGIAGLQINAFAISWVSDNGDGTTHLTLIGAPANPMTVNETIDSFLTRVGQASP